MKDRPLKDLGYRLTCSNFLLFEAVWLSSDSFTSNHAKSCSF